MAEYVIDGGRIAGIPDLYAELNRLFMAEEDWTLGDSLDALDDLLYGGIGALVGDDQPRVVWRESGRSREVLGRDATAAWLRGKLSRPGVFSTASTQRRLDALMAGTGPTYFDLVVEVFEAHPAVELELR